jgi:hypothetical protein
MRLLQSICVITASTLVLVAHAVPDALHEIMASGKLAPSRAKMVSRLEAT